MFQLLFVHYTFSSVWVTEWPPFGNSSPLGWPYVLIVFFLIYFPFYKVLKCWKLAPQTQCMLLIVRSKGAINLKFGGGNSKM